MPYLCQSQHATRFVGAPAQHTFGVHCPPTRMTLSARKACRFANWNIVKRVRVLCVAALIRASIRVIWAAWASGNPCGLVGLNT